MTEEKLCPVCGEIYDKTSFTTQDAMNYKIFIHEKKRCKMQNDNIIVPRYLIKNVVINASIDDDIIEGILLKYCKYVQIESTDNHDFYFPDANFAVKRYGVEDFYIGMISRGNDEPEILRKAEAMKSMYGHVAILISGNPSIHASEVLDIVSTDINIKIRQIIGYMASIGVKYDLDACFSIENDAELTYWAIKHASSIIKKNKST